MILCPVIMGASAHAYIDKTTAVVRVMNKAAGRATTVNLPVGGTTEYEKLMITTHACKQTDPFQAEDFLGFFEINRDGNRIFSGWMSRNEPGYNPLQNADYDIWLVRCE
jgi:hypothetical protein